MTIFRNMADAIAELKADRLVVAAEMYLGGVMPSDDYLRRKLLASEALVSRELSVFLEPTRVFSHAPDPSEIDALGGMPYVVEPGYDLDPDWLTTRKWGALRLRRRPVISIEKVRIVYPSGPMEFFDVPRNWVQFDDRSGTISVIPGSGLQYGPLSLFALQSLAANNRVPHMIQVDYVSGIDARLDEYADVYDLIMQMAVLSVLQDTMMMGSSSISADGLSQSISSDLPRLREQMEDRIATMRAKLIGPTWDVL